MYESIDTLDIPKQFQRKGQSEELAEEFAEILKEREERAVVTKRDLAELEIRLLSELRTIKVNARPNRATFTHSSLTLAFFEVPACFYRVGQ